MTYNRELRDEMQFKMALFQGQMLKISFDSKRQQVAQNSGIFFSFRVHGENAMYSLLPDLVDIHTWYSSQLVPKNYHRRNRRDILCIPIALLHPGRANHKHVFFTQPVVICTNYSDDLNQQTPKTITPIRT